MRLSRFELQVMEVLWRTGEVSVREVHEALPQDHALMFAPAITRKAVHRRLIDELLDLVGGSQPLLAHLVDSGKLSVDDLKAIEKRARK